MLWEYQTPETSVPLSDKSAGNVMRLLLSMLGWPDGTKPELREIDDELAIGRGRESGWMLPDPASQLSRRHCLLTPFGDGWRVTDLSLNGTFINDASIPLGRQQAYELHDGDRIRIGAYIIEARYQAPASLREPVADRSPFEFPPAGSSLPAQMPPHHWEQGARAPEPFPDDFGGGFETRGRPMPDDFLGQPSADHSPAVSDAWHAPAPSRVVIPDDWDLEDVAPATPAKPPPPAVQRQTVPPPVAPPADDWNLDDLAPAQPAVGPIISAPVVPVVQQAPATMVGDAALLAAFLRGVGLRDVGDTDPTVMMESVGAMLRTMVDRLREVQAARGAIKREFRILATMVNPEDNNPIKFSASNEAALQSLLTGKRPPDRAVGEVLDEIRLHELAMIAAMRDAVSGLLEELSPARLRTAETGLANMLPVQRKARAFDQYEALHARTVQALTDDFDSVFGKAFARAYERVALDEEKPPMRTRR
jgi:type VI secretion system protein ImpI/type VI secretion system protein